MPLLSQSFYKRNTQDVARDLLGCFLVRQVGKKMIRARIVETEAYVGEDDLACHASKGRTKRTEVMYGEAGHAYVYLIYGMYYLLNVVTDKKDFPAAVLIRAVEIEGIPHKKTNGPGKLTKFLQINQKQNTWNLTAGEELWIEKGSSFAQATAGKGKIIATKRIGIDYAKHCKEYLWRFLLK